MNFDDIFIKIGIVIGTIIFLWLFFKLLKIIWKLSLIVMICLVLSFALPSMREWVLGVF